MKAYIAGPLFNDGERWYVEQVDKIARNLGFDTFLPHRDGKELLPANRDITAIFELDRDEIDDSDIVIANLDGIAVDDGTAWEIGYAYARGKHIIGIHRDMRTHSHDQFVNLMIQCSLHKLVHSLEELNTYLTSLPPLPQDASNQE